MIKHFNRWGWIVLTGILSVLIIYLRKGDVFFHPQFWAEDGTIFFREFVESGLGSITNPYNGYLHVFPRLWVAIGSILPIPFEYLPGWYNLGWWLFYIVYVLLIRKHSAFPAWGKVLLGILPLIMPAGNESLVNLTNAHWMMGIVLIVALSFRDKEHRPSPWLIFFTALTGLSSPHVIIFLPVIIFQFFQFKDWRSAKGSVFLLVSVIVAAIQLHFLTGYNVSRSNGSGAATFAGIIDLCIDVLYVPFTGYAILSAGLWVKMLLLLPFLGLLTLTFLKPPPRVKTWVPLICCILMVSIVIRSFGNNIINLEPVISGSRYFYIPVFCLLFAWMHQFRQQFISLGLPVLLVLTSLILHRSFFTAGRLEEFDLGYYNTKIKTEPFLVIPANPPGFNILLDRREGWNDTTAFPHFYHRHFSWNLDAWNDTKEHITVSCWACSPTLKNFNTKLVILFPYDTVRWEGSIALRPDVSALFGNESCITSGINFTIPKKQFPYGEFPLFIEVRDSAGFYWERLPLNLIHLP